MSDQTSTSLLDLFLPPGDDGPGPDGEYRMSAGQQVRQVIWLAFRAARASAKARKDRDDSLLGEFCRSHQPNVDEQVAYAHNRSWVQPGYEGGFMDKIGTWYQRLVAIPAIAAGDAWKAFWKHGTRPAIAFAVASLLAVSWLIASLVFH